MIKRLITGILLFAAGAVVTFTVVANPFDWHVIHTLQSKLGIAHEAPADSTPGQLWTCGMHPEVISEEPGECPICFMKLTPLKGSTAGTSPSTGATKERKIKHWRAPMDPTYISDKPGKSPMGMDLIPVFEDEEEGEAPGIVEIDPVFVQNMGVQTEPAQRTDIPFTIRTVGNLTYDDQQVSWVTTKYSGWIEKVYVNYVGESVEVGQKLFEIYSPELVTAQQEYLDALDYADRMSRTNYEDVAGRANSLVGSARQRLAYWDVSEEDIQRLQASREVRRTLPIVATTSGLVVERMNQALEGMYVRPGMNLYKVVDLATIWVEAEVFEHQVPWLRIGQKARVELPYQPGRRYQATVRYIFPSINRTTRSLKVSLELPNPNLQLRADMYADVIFDVPNAQGVVAVPEEAVIHSGTRDVIVLQLGEGRFQVREVELGVNGSGLWEVRNGVSEGDLVVVSSQFLIDSESNLREAIRKLVSERSRRRQEGTSGH